MFLGCRYAALLLLAPLVVVLLPACGQLISDASYFRRGVWPVVEPVATVSPDCLDDPALRPSLRELRQARADAWLEREIAAGGGLIRYADDGSSSWPDKVKFVAAPNALALGIRADSCLNFIDGAPQTLVLTIYHLTQPVNINHLLSLENREQDLSKGIGPRFIAEEMNSVIDMAVVLPVIRLGASVVGVERFTIQPGQNGILSLSRPENGRYIAIVADYRQRDDSGANFTHVAEYPIGRYEQKEKGWAFLPRHVTMFRPLPLNLEVELGPGAMRIYESGKLLHPLRDVRVASAYRVY
ncbi:MAG: type VI secretion lipoprotein TssJ [Planctomycetota bacterium]|jgi:hypothetical protein|nr:type VI secretion lipoprotein TssJ [Planctomycetota bacterium]